MGMGPLSSQRRFLSGSSLWTRCPTGFWLLRRGMSSLGRGACHFLWDLLEEGAAMRDCSLSIAMSARLSRICSTSRPRPEPSAWEAPNAPEGMEETTKKPTKKPTQSPCPNARPRAPGATAATSKTAKIAKSSAAAAPRRAEKALRKKDAAAEAPHLALNWTQSLVISCPRMTCQRGSLSTHTATWSPGPGAFPCPSRRPSKGEVAMRASSLVENTASM
mmetsp:Transcript_12589/g.27743  ORF Transcript_12589/g.27743 Transcript_12589/m.27743 type:complete len:219 (+) Transcript_12589:904-1560(+)